VCSIMNRISAAVEAFRGCAEHDECSHDNIMLAADSTMGEGNQRYFCSECGKEVSEDEYIRSQGC